MLYIVISIVIAAFDQLFKRWIVATVPPRGEFSVIPGFFHLTYVKNTGAAFSMMSGMRWLLFGVAVVCAVGMVLLILRVKLSAAERLAVSFILGGAVGNAIDRAFLGYVIDMFEVEFVHYAIFNVADCFIVIGGALFCIAFIVGAIKDEKKKKLKMPTHMPELDRLRASRPENTEAHDDKADQS